MTLGFLGTGAITSAIVTGLRAAASDHDIVVSPRTAGVAANLTRQFPHVFVASALRRPPSMPQRCLSARSQGVKTFCAPGRRVRGRYEEEFAAVCSVTATMATYFAFAETATSWLSRQGIPPDQARDYVARIYSGLGMAAVDGSNESFQTLAADHAARGGTNEQLLKHMQDNGVFDRFSEGRDGILRRVTAASK
jgi:pyrroline-5-carboxylate reductase